MCMFHVVALKLTYLQQTEDFVMNGASQFGGIFNKIGQLNFCIQHTECSGNNTKAISL